MLGSGSDPSFQVGSRRVKTTCGMKTTCVMLISKGAILLVNWLGGGETDFIGGPHFTVTPVTLA